MIVAREQNGKLNFSSVMGVIYLVRLNCIVIVLAGLHRFNFKLYVNCEYVLGFTVLFSQYIGICFEAIINV